MSNIINRRNFLSRAATITTASLFAPAILTRGNNLTPQMPIIKNDISLAQWALVNEIREGKWKTLDFPRIAREEFDLNGIEFVNTLFEVPTFRYLNQLKQNAEDHGVKMVLIMVDAEGETCTPSKSERMQTVTNHKKWIDIANYLGCHAIRTNCRGPQDAHPDEALNWAAETYHMMLEYSVPNNISILIENHGGFSDDTNWMVELMKKVNSKYFGTLPDWRNPDVAYDNVEYVKKMLPWAHGMSFRNQPTEELNAKMIRMTYDAGFRGWYGIESPGRKNIQISIDLLKKYLFNR